MHRHNSESRRSEKGIAMLKEEVPLPQFEQNFFELYFYA